MRNKNGDDIMISVNKIKRFALSVTKAVENTPQLAECKEDLKILCAMLSDCAKGNYKYVSKRNVVIAGVCIAYVLSPIDFIPDFVPVLGQIDDVAVICFLLKTVKKELGFYKIWLETQKDKILN